MLRFHFHIQCLYTVFLTVTCIYAQHIANMAQVWVMSRIPTSSNLSSTKIFIYFFIYSAYPVQSVLLLCCKILAAAALGGGGVARAGVLRVGGLAARVRVPALAAPLFRPLLWAASPLHNRLGTFLYISATEGRCCT
jgi:hypothetical protein